VVKKSHGKSREKAMAIEAEGFCNVAGGEVSRNLVNLFFMMEAVKKRTGVADTSVKPREVKNIAVLGAGTMGGGIAYVAADNGVHVRMKDITTDAISKGFQAASKVWDKLLKNTTNYKIRKSRKINLRHRWFGLFGLSIHGRSD
jgi:3-hydroxyacyl-CoA dehydrogenase / enoyl-CoA hydratase / 3-hydroxybutyryl-CoA epimerase